MSKFKNTFCRVYERPVNTYCVTSTQFFLIATLRSKDLPQFNSNTKRTKENTQKRIWQKSCLETFSRLIFELCMIATKH